MSCGQQEKEIYVEDALSDAGGSGEGPDTSELLHSHAIAVEETVGHMLEAVNSAADGVDPETAIKSTVEAELGR